MKLQILQGNCLCHGNFGTISILRHYGEKMGCYEAIELSKFMLNYIMKSNEDDFIKDCERYNPGIMIGATGIYYAMLKQYPCYQKYYYWKFNYRIEVVL